MTEAVYTIEGQQRDETGCSPTGTLCFNPPGSGHQITDSTGFFLIAYKSPPDFERTDLIQAYRPIRLNLLDGIEGYPFKAVQNSVEVCSIPLKESDVRSQLIKSASSTCYHYSGNYLLVLKGCCCINGEDLSDGSLVTAMGTAPQSYAISCRSGGSCLLLGLAFSDRNLPKLVGIRSLRW